MESNKIVSDMICEKNYSGRSRGDNIERYR